MGMINFNLVLRDLDGEPFNLGEADRKKLGQDFLTLGVIITRALLNAPPNKRLSGDESFERYEFAKDIKKVCKEGGVLTITTKNKKLIKEAIADIATPELLGAVYEALDNEIKEDEEVKSKVKNIKEGNKKEKN